MAPLLVGIALGAGVVLVFGGIGAAAWWDRRRQPEPTMGLGER